MDNEKKNSTYKSNPAEFTRSLKNQTELQCSGYSNISTNVEKNIKCCDICGTNKVLDSCLACTNKCGICSDCLNEIRLLQDEAETWENLTQNT